MIAWNTSQTTGVVDPPRARGGDRLVQKGRYGVIALVLLLAGCAVRVVTPSAAAANRPPVSGAFGAPVPGSEPAARPVQLNFRILEARARIGSRDYVLDVHNRPVITDVGDNIYRLDLPLRRDSRSSLRGDETITTHFYYDGTELIFFGDKNRNQRFDRREASVRHLINHTHEIVTEGNRRFMQARSLDVTLNKAHISSYQRIDTLQMRLVFQ